MNKCLEQDCPLNKTICCHDCDERCSERCEHNFKECGNAEPISEELVKVEQKYPNLLQDMKDFMVQKKIMDAKEQDFKKKLKDAMEQFNIKKIDNDFFTVSYVAETTRTSVDTKKLKEDHPDIAEKYKKTSKVSSSVRLKVK